VEHGRPVDLHSWPKLNSPRPPIGTMRISILAVGTRMQSWVDDGVAVYSQRLPRHIQLQVAEITPGQRGSRVPVVRAMEKEADQLMKRAAGADLTIALDEAGTLKSSADLATDMQGWLNDTPHVAFLIGGADGLTDRCKKESDRIWSLSKLTLPHGLVRVVLVEQLYRAWTILQGHPYHRI
jgi:23S rRNA (pseudouridine1915-N3)-methyltransferase